MADVTHIYSWDGKTGKVLCRDPKGNFLVEFSGWNHGHNGLWLKCHWFPKEYRDPSKRNRRWFDAEEWKMVVLQTADLDIATTQISPVGVESAVDTINSVSSDCKKDVQSMTACLPETINKNELPEEVLNELNAPIDEYGLKTQEMIAAFSNQLNELITTASAVDELNMTIQNVYDTLTEMDVVTRPAAKWKFWETEEKQAKRIDCVGQQLDQQLKVALSDYLPAVNKYITQLKEYEVLGDALRQTIRHLIEIGAQADSHTNKSVAGILARRMESLAVARIALENNIATIGRQIQIGTALTESAKETANAASLKVQYAEAIRKARNSLPQNYN